MKKYIRMMLSVVLTLMLVLSVLPIGAFAAESDEDVALEAVEEEIVEVNAGCSHIYEMQVVVTYEYSDPENHIVKDVMRYQCIHCMYSYTVSLGNSALQAHRHSTLNPFYTHFEKSGVMYHTLWNNCYCNLCDNYYTRGIVTTVCDCES